VAPAESGPIVLLPPQKTADKSLSAASVVANIAARRALIVLADGKRAAAPASGPGNSIWTALARRKPEYRNVLDEESDAAWLLRLVELHLAANDVATAMSLSDFVVTSRTLRPTKSQKSFAHFRRAKAAYQLHAALQPGERGLKEAIADYELAVKIDKEAPWCGDALFLAGNIHWNQFNDGDSAIRLWKEAARRYPKSRLAENAGYNIGAIYQHNGETQKAKAAFAEFKGKYPESKFLAALNGDGLAAHLKAVPPKDESPAMGAPKTKSDIRNPKARPRE
jgi:tetratricopeptide (TPR) repeat protein